MPESQHQEPKDIQLYHKGVNLDDDQELLAASDKGYAVDAQNMRPTQINSHQGSDSKINGEVIAYGNVDNRCINGSGLPIFGNYECIGSATVLSKVVEFWADKDNIGLPFVRVNGWVVLFPKTFIKFPLLTTFPLQISVNDSCVGGEVCVTDFHIAPFVLNVEDMLKNSGIDPATNSRNTTLYPCTQKYFDDFDIAKYQVQLNRPVDHPIFVEVVSAGSTPNTIGRTETHGTGGMQGGSYQYSIRFSNTAGDVALFSENTPLIPIPKALSTQSPQYPGAKTYGAIAATGTALGTHIRFRVSNLLDFDQIEVKRTSFIFGAAIGTPGTEEIVAKIAIIPQEFSIVDFYDYDNTFIDLVTPEESVDSMSSIEAAKAIRYYNSRLFLMNIKYESRDLTGKVVFDQFLSPANEMLPFSFSLGKQGYNDIYNDVYKKSYFRGEKYGWATVFYDANGARSFGFEVPNNTNVKMPERRDPILGDSFNLSTSLLPNSAYAVAQESTAPYTNVARTYEVFDLIDSITKTNHYANSGGTGSVDTSNNILNIIVTGSKDSASAPLPYRAFHPTSDVDTDVTEHNLVINPEVKIDGSGYVGYNPKGFSPNLYSLGMSLAGIKTMPSWVKAFSVVRTAPANRVIAQGQSFYQMDDANDEIEKIANKLWWQSPDTYTGIVSVPNLLSNFSAYQFQAVSALGFFSEVYGGRHNGTLIPVSQVSDGIDIVHYARILRDNGEINYNVAPAISVAGINSGGVLYTAFNSWRNSIASLVTPNQTFALSSFLVDGRGSQHRGKPFSIQLPTIYSTPGTSGDIFYKDANVKDFHEPVYVMNVVDPNANVPQSNIQEYFETGSYIKVESIISISDGLTKKYYLVDERWEDCIPALDPSFPTSAQDRYVYLQDDAGNEQVWLNVTFKTIAQVTTIKNDIFNNGFYISTRADGSITNITGIYTHTNTNNRLFTIEFNQVDVNSVPFIPQPGDKIIVRYDHNAPIEVFGGDTFIGDFNYAPVDAKLKSSIDGNGYLDPDGSGDVVWFDRPMPYHEFHIDENVFIIRRTKPPNRIQDNNKIKFRTDLSGQSGRVRNQLVSGIVESRINTALDFGQRFPEVNYVMHPYLWDTSTTPDPNINTSYFTDYPNETNLFGYGGFRFLPSANADYSALPVNLKHFSKPKAGFKENLHFCSEVIWSQKRPINKSNAPGILTFPPLHVFDLGDETGAIKFAWDAMAGNGTNLYAVTEHGVAMLLTEKRLLTELSGAQLAAIGSTDNTVIQESVWISKNVGMNDEWWRSKAEWDNTLYFTNRNSSYRLNNNKLDDIGRMMEGSKYYKRLRETINMVGQGYATDVTAMYDALDNEYWLQVCTPIKKIGWYTQAILGYPPVNLWITFVANISLTPPPPTLTSIQISANQNISVVNDQITDIDLRFLNITGSPITICNNQTLAINIWHDPLPATNGPQPAQLLVIIQAGECYELTHSQTLTYKWSAQKINSLNLCRLPVWSEKTGGSWIGQFKHRFDRYTIIDNRMFGSRNIETWELNKGFIINGAPVEGWVLQATVGGSQNLNKSKEFIRLRVAGDGEPQRVDFYDNIEQFESSAPTGTLDIITNPQFSLKDYGAFEQYIPRGTASPRRRQQGRLMLFKMIHNLPAPFKIIDTAISYKNLK